MTKHRQRLAYEEGVQKQGEDLCPLTHFYIYIHIYIYTYDQRMLARPSPPTTHVHVCQQSKRNVFISLPRCGILLDNSSYLGDDHVSHGASKPIKRIPPLVPCGMLLVANTHLDVGFDMVQRVQVASPFPPSCGVYVVANIKDFNEIIRCNRIASQVKWCVCASG